jgi:pimeloyl-ACP methyl ester carboxylesterase
MQTATSKDGTKIAFEKVGQGPAVILVDGATGSRASGFSTKLAELLSPDFTVYYYDRRGRGDSTDTQPFAVQREIEDIEALIDDAGGASYLYGISSGGSLALEAAIKLGGKVKKLAIYEAPYNSDPADKQHWLDYYTKLKQLLADDKPGDAMAHFMKFVGAPEEMIEGMRQSPMWTNLEAVAPTLLYDAEAMGGEEGRAVPLERARAVTAATLTIDGEANLQIMPFMRTTAEALAEAIPNARHRTLAGQTHDVDPNVLAPVLIEFFKD